MTTRTKAPDWTPAEDSLLRSLRDSGLRWKEIAQALLRGYSAVRKRACLLAKRERTPRPTPEGALLLARREQLGLSQHDLARLTGVAQSHISNIESGRYVPRAETLDTLRRALGVPLDELLAHLSQEAS